MPTLSSQRRDKAFFLFHEHFKLIASLPLSGVDKSVLHILNRYSNYYDGTGARPSIDRIVNDCGFGRTAVTDSLKRSVECGVLVLVKQQHRRPTEYRLDFEMMETIALSPSDGCNEECDEPVLHPSDDSSVRQTDAMCRQTDARSPADGCHPILEPIKEPILEPIAPQDQLVERVDEELTDPIDPDIERMSQNHAAFLARTKAGRRYHEVPTDTQAE